MREARHVTWLREQLPGLVDQGVLSADAAERVRRHYPELEGSGRRLATVAVGVLGAALIGGGIILLLAHNWAELSRATRAAISLAPLVVAQLIAAWVLLRDESLGWRESVAVFWTFAIGAALALVDQTYHLGGGPDEIGLRWLLLAVPVCYLMRSTAVATLLLLGSTIWAPIAEGVGRAPWGVVVLLLLAPFVIARLRRHRGSPGTTLLGWVLPPALTMVLGTASADTIEWIAPIILSTLFGWFLIVDHSWSVPGAGFVARPWALFGRAGITILLLILTFEDASDMVNGGGLGRAFAEQTLQPLLWLLALAALCVVTWRQRASLRTKLAWISVPVLFVSPMLLGFGYDERLLQALANLSLLVLGISAIVAGFSRDSLRQLNLGIAVLAVLMIARFFDSDIDFVFRGVAFIVIGLMFFGLNWALVHKRAAAIKEGVLEEGVLEEGVLK